MPDSLTPVLILCFVAGAGLGCALAVALAPRLTDPPRLFESDLLTALEIRQICHRNGWDDSHQSIRYGQAVQSAALAKLQASLDRDG